MGRNNHQKIHLQRRAWMFTKDFDFTPVHRSEIRGMDVLCSRLSNIAERIKRFPEMKVDIGAGAVFYGPKGMGKTYAAKHIATEVAPYARVVDIRAFPRFKDDDGRERALSPFDIRTMYALAYEYIERHNKAVVFFCDEFDNIEEDAIEELRVILDGMKERRNGVFLLLTSNQSSEELDEERLFRHKRISDHIGFYYATEKGKTDIIRHHTERYPHEKNIDFESMVALLKRETTAAALAELPRRAYSTACLDPKNKKPIITQRLLLAECVVEAFGPPVEDTLAEEGRRLIAIHEAGHAVFAHLIGLRVIASSVVPRAKDGDDGLTMVAFLEREVDPLSRHEDNLVYGFGGIVAERLLGYRPMDTLEQDLAVITAGARQYVEKFGGGAAFRRRYGFMVCHMGPDQYSNGLREIVERDTARLIKRAEQRAWGIVKECGRVRIQQRITRIADALMEHGVLLRNELLELLEK